MGRMLDMIKQSAVPANLMRTAARGALALPPAEMLEILVHLSEHALFGQQARLTLAEWDEKSAYAVLADPATPASVVEYFSDPANRRPVLIPALIENPAVDDLRLLEIAQTASREVARLMLHSERVQNSAIVLHALEANPNCDAAQHELINSALTGLREAIQQSAEAEESAPAEDLSELPELTEFLRKFAKEIEAEQNKAFELVRSDHDEPDELADLIELSAPASDAVVAGESTKAAVARVPAKPPEQKRISTLQKIAALNVGERVQLAMKGTKDERFILIRDGSKIVSLAVLESPKVTDQEVETFAAMKNVQEAVLRGIAGKRKFMKNYAVIRTLVNNPRTPFDLALPLMQHLLVMDLKHLSMNKNVGDTLRKVAVKMFRDKTTNKKHE